MFKLINRSYITYRQNDNISFIRLAKKYNKLLDKNNDINKTLTFLTDKIGKLKKDKIDLHKKIIDLKNNKNI